MKPAVLAAIVGGVFVVGVGAGALLSAGGGEAPPVDRVPTAPRRAPEAAPRVTFDGGSVVDPNAAAQGEPSAPEGPGSDPAPRTPAGAGATFVGDEPPSEPPPLPPGALDAEADLRREQAADPDGRGGGRVTTLVYEFESEEEKQAWEARYKKRWETRLQREIEIKLKIMREKVGLQAHQETALRKILQAEFEERGRLVEQLTAKQISQTGFNEGVQANVRKAREAMQALLSPEQYAAYKQLKPREQVLQDEVK